LNALRTGVQDQVSFDGFKLPPYELTCRVVPPSETRHVLPTRIA
jgi:hypothetical protein